MRTEFDLNPTVASRLSAGESFDLGMTNPEYVPDLIARGLVTAHTHIPFGRVPLAIARIGQPAQGVVKNRDAIRDMLTEAGSIAYTREGTSGGTFLRVVEELGLTEALSGKLRPMEAGEPVLAAAAGHSDLAIAPLTVVAATAGVREWAIFPGELRAEVDMSMFVMSQARDPKLAQKVIRFLSHHRNDDFLEEAGLYRFRFA